MEDVKVITFDLYGTLVDWKGSIGNALNYIKPGLTEEFFNIEYEHIKNLKRFEKYSLILKKTLKELLQRNEIEYDDDLGNFLVRMFSKSPFFPDSVIGLIKIKKKYKVGIISNTERNLIKITLSGMEDLFDYIVTAEDTKFYKPHEMAFIKAFEIMNVNRNDLIHISSYPQYDLETARKLGIRNVHLNRYGYSWSDEIKSLVEILNTI